MTGLKKIGIEKDMGFAEWDGLGFRLILSLFDDIRMI